MFNPPLSVRTHQPANQISKAAMPVVILSRNISWHHRVSWGQQPLKPTETITDERWCQASEGQTDPGWLKAKLIHWNEGEHYLDAEGRWREREPEDDDITCGREGETERAWGRDERRQILETSATPARRSGGSPEQRLLAAAHLAPQVGSGGVAASGFRRRRARQAAVTSVATHAMARCAPCGGGGGRVGRTGWPYGAR